MWIFGPTPAELEWRRGEGGDFVADLWLFLHTHTLMLLLLDLPVFCFGITRVYFDGDGGTSSGRLNEILIF